jgi:hypothetical protein
MFLPRLLLSCLLYLCQIFIDIIKSWATGGIVDVFFRKSEAKISVSCSK